MRTRQTKQGVIIVSPSPIERRFNEHLAEILQQDPNAKLLKDGNGGMKIVGNVSDELKRKVNGG